MAFDGTYPRPQLARDTWLGLDGIWGFAFDDAGAGLTDGWHERCDVFDREITVPFPPESRASGIHDHAFHPVVWYRRGWVLPSGHDGQRWLLHFGAVDYRAHVWVNGQLVATHEGGHTPFSADITAALAAGQNEQIIVVRAEDQPRDIAQPRGKQHWEADPADIWYHRTTGIWQPVWLEPVHSVHIVSVRWTPDPEADRLGLTVRLSQQPTTALRLSIRLTMHDQVLADDAWRVDKIEVGRDLHIPLPTTRIARERLLWSPEHPNLIEATITLCGSGDDHPLDQVASYAGLRSTRTHEGRFLLNGEPYYLRMALEQGYWPSSHLAAPSAEAIRREVELAKALGFNGLRLHQKVEDPRFLAWCDHLGMVVWGEMPNAYTFSEVAIERFAHEWLEVIRRDYSHPSIVTWVPFNESWGVFSLEHSERQQDYVRAIYYLTRSLDPTRPVIGNDGWEHFASDIWGIHDYALDTTIIQERYGSAAAFTTSMTTVQPFYRPIALPSVGHSGQPVMLTECGGIDFVPGVGNPDGQLRRADDLDDFLNQYDAFIAAVLACTPVQGFCYTQLTDVEQEKSGLLTEDREPKADLDILRRLTTRPAAAIPAQTTFA